MTKLLDCVVDLAELLPPARTEMIARRLLASVPNESPLGLEGAVGTPAAREAVHRMVELWTASDVDVSTLAGMLLGAARAVERARAAQSVELVWTGPTTPSVPTRQTEQVLLRVIENATARLFLASFVAYDVPRIVSALNAAIDRGSAVRLLLESSLGQGGHHSVDPFAAMRARVPRAELYTWRAKSEPFVGGRVHAKVAVADGRVAFITSANLTGYALEKNMEAGVLIEGGRVPRALDDHLRALIDSRIIARAI